jgi:hypothetical protein
MEMRQAKASSHQAAIAKEFFYSSRRCVRSNVKILRFSTKQEIADSSSNQEGNMSVVLEPIEYFKNVGADHGPRDGMLLPVNDSVGLRLFHTTMNTI